MPAGVDDGNKLRVKAEGDAGAKGGPVGDLYVFLNVKSDPKYKRTGKDIYSEQKVTDDGGGGGGSRYSSRNETDLPPDAIPSCDHRVR